MIPTSRLLRILLALFLQAAAALVAQTAPAQPAAAAPAPKPQPDTVMLNDDEKLIGHLLRADAAAVVFKSDLLGEVTIEWSKIKELHAAGRYAVLEKRVRLGRHADTSGVPKGSLDVAGQTIAVHPEPGAAPRSIPVANTGTVVDETTFTNDVEHNPGLLKAWNGAVTAGASLVESTQQSRAFNGGIHLVRAVPGVTWLNPRDRTTLDFNALSGFVSQPNTPRVKTDIIHGDAERDEYLSGSRVYGFAQAIFDHNYSQGLDLQQSYGGGIGWTTIQTAALTLDFKGSMTYVRQQFAAPNPPVPNPPELNHNLVASTIDESLTRHLPRGMTLLEQISATPTWNELHAWQATASTSFNAPVFKRLSFTIGVQDNFLNDPPPGFHKNSFQATTGLTYSLR